MSNQRHQKASSGKMLHHNGMLASELWLGSEAEPWEETNDFLLAIEAVKQETSESPIYLWDANMTVKQGDTVIYNDIEYEVIQLHVTQINWTPDIATSLYKKKMKPADEWVQPTHAENAYKIGDTATHNNGIYESLINSNTTVPGSDARWWKLVG